MSKKLTRLLRPESIAVVGGQWAAAVIEQCRALGFTGPIWPVHPEHQTLAGEACFRHVDQLPTGPDAVFVGVNNNLTVEIVESLSRLGAGGAVCFASGFSESARLDGEAENRQRRLVEAAGDMPIVGPNCYGLLNYLDRIALWPDQHGGKPVDSGVAIITQSSNIAVNLTMQQRGLPLAYVLTAGNQAQIGLAEIAAAVLQDQRVTALGLHVEGFTDIPAYEALSRLARSIGKHIVVLKTGVTPLSRAALLSHTRSLSGNDAAASAFIERLNMIRVQGIGEFIETLKVLHGPRAVGGYRLMSMSCSGGEAALIGDTASDVGLQFPPLQDSQKEALQIVLGDRLRLSNPLDYHTQIWEDAAAMQAMVKGMLQTRAVPDSATVSANDQFESPADIALLVLDFPREDRCAFPSWQAAADTFVMASKQWQGFTAILSTLPENMPESIAEALMDEGVVALCGLRDGLLALRNAAWLTLAAQTEPAAPVWLPDRASPIAQDAMLSFIEEQEASSEEQSARHASQIAWGLDRPGATKRDAIRQLDESTAKRWLTRFGVAVPVSFRLSFADVRSSLRMSKALDKASPVFTYPVVAKGLGLTHKSEANGIALNIKNRHELERAIRRIDCAGGCLVEEYVEGAAAELLVSVIYDPVHGLLMTISAGGVTTELLQDSVCCLLPASRDEMDRRVKLLRCAPLLNGFRGRAVVDRERLLDTLIAIQQAALQLGDRLVELEINPLLCSADVCTAVDALVSVRDSV